MHGHGGNPARKARHKHDQSVFHSLLQRYDELHREVEQVPGGIRTRTWTDSADLVPLLHDHVEQMHRRVTEGFGLRFWDPAFAELFAQKDKVRMEVRRTPTGVEVTETSDDANVVKLIRAHGGTVSAFVREGARAAARESPLPDDYRRVL